MSTSTLEEIAVRSIGPVALVPARRPRNPTNLADTTFNFQQGFGGKTLQKQPQPGLLGSAACTGRRAVPCYRRRDCLSAVAGSGVLVSACHLAVDLGGCAGPQPLAGKRAHRVPIRGHGLTRKVRSPSSDHDERAPKLILNGLALSALCRPCLFDIASSALRNRRAAITQAGRPCSGSRPSGPVSRAKRPSPP
jgi:hypothetical protein